MSDTKNIIVSLVTINPEKVASASVPIFYEDNLDDAEKTAEILARITRGVVHSLGNGILVIAKH